MSRDPYTYASDYIREEIGNDYDHGIMSRCAASRVRTLIADSIGMNDKELAITLAEKFKEKWNIKD